MKASSLNECRRRVIPLSFHFVKLNALLLIIVFLLFQIADCSVM